MGSLPSLEMLSRNGIVEFDAESYVRCQPQPQPLNGFDVSPQYEQLSRAQLKSDIYQSTKEPSLNPPLWKKLALGGIILVSIAAIALKGKLNPTNWFTWIKGKLPKLSKKP